MVSFWPWDVYGSRFLVSPASDRRVRFLFVIYSVWANNGDAISRCYAGTSVSRMNTNGV